MVHRFALLLSLLGCAEEEATSPSPGARPAASDALVLQVDYGSEKKAWMEDAVQRFEATSPHLASGKAIDVVTRAAGSGEVMADILAGRARPHVYSPASAAYLSLLDQQWLSQPGHTRPLAGAGDPLILSPLVIAMWKPMAEALGWPGKALGWKDILAVSTDPAGWAAYGHGEWGRMKLGHTHPGLSNSGLLAVLAEAYAGAGKTRGLGAADLSAPETAAFVQKVEASLVHYGKSTSFLYDKMLSRGPSYVSAAVIYENQVVDSYSKLTPGSMPLVALYPVEGTFWSDHPYTVLDADWVDAEHREAAGLLKAFLKAKPQQELALQYGFRPGDPSVAIAAPLDAAHGVDTAQPQTLLELPDGATLRGVLDLWTANKKTSDVTLVFDRSGSMEGEPLAQAKAGAQAFVDGLSDRDQLSLLFFDSVVGTPSAPIALSPATRAQVATTLQGVIADGGTALYDAVRVAYQDAMQRAAQHPGAIHAVVVLTDGRDANSAATLEALTADLTSQREAPVKVFTIA